MRGLDTNILVRYVTDDDPRMASAAEALMAEASERGEELIVQPVVVCELVWVLETTFSYSRESIGAVLKLILESFEVPDRGVVEAALADFMIGPGDFADYYIGRANEHAGADTTLTFHRKLKAHPRFRLVR